MKARPRPTTVAALLFCSGFCALIYQTVWLREFRLIFGASTAASAAVLGIFMGGLGLGSAMLGRRAEAAAKPLLLYGNLELMIALFAALTPAIVQGVRWLYSATGGTMVLGHGIGTVVRLLMASLVLIGPTFLMGGTLPAAARSIASDKDPCRRRLALLYGTNTLGAVTGAALSTFWLIEVFGNRTALWLATGLNTLVALVARAIARNSEALTPAEESAPVAVQDSTVEAESSASVPMVVCSSALVGFAFMVMELVWYRMLGPILGGSTFTFGLILVVALLGIGVGGIAYTLRRSDRVATLNGFAFTCAIEALFMAIPYALGDRLAFLALMLRSLGSLGFAYQVLGWFIVASIVVLPASIVAGYQFPMLISLLGRGRAGVARHTGLAYAANTVGAIVGSLAGGFGLMPLLTAPGVWKLVAAMLAVLAVVAAFLGGRRLSFSRLAPLGASVLAIALVFSEGPTAVWRHAGIGAGRSRIPNPTLNSLKSWAYVNRRSVMWEAEGLESSVALQAQSALSFVVNGKIDGNSRMDAGTQSMGGLLGALLHPAPRKAMVIGLGTGSTAGWLGSLPELERVDVVELEPAILDVARFCAPVNNDVMNNPKVRNFLGDAREVLITTPEKYDIIFSEPSNPYRAGIASLFTSDFYEAAQHRLAPRGIFAQWIQCYEIDVDTIRTVLGTVGKTFPYVQAWRTQLNDLILIGTKEPLTLDADTLRQRIATPTFKAALFNAWRVDSLEGVLSHFVANEELVQRVIASGPDLATDDRNPLEYGFARGQGRTSNESVSPEIVGYSRTHKLDRLLYLTGSVDWDAVAALGPATDAVEKKVGVEIIGESPDRRARRLLFADYLVRNHSGVMKIVRDSKLVPLGPIELEAFAESAVFTSDPIADELIQKVEVMYPSEAVALRACQAAMRKDWRAAAEGYASAFRVWQKDPWVRPAMLQAFLANALYVAQSSRNPDVARLLYDTLATPFAVELMRELRLNTRVELAKLTEPNPVNARVREAFQAYGAHPDWTAPFLEQRLLVYQKLQHPDAASAAEDLATFRDNETAELEKLLRSSTPPVARPTPPTTAAN
jgi:spermidine synthase